MKGVSPTTNKGSPKTPGGISKSLLTPCRRVGLSRKWKKSGCSPFISPLSTQNSTPENDEISETKKRKKCDDKEILKKTPKEQVSSEESNVTITKSCSNSQENSIITTTPSRIQIPRNKSITLSLTLKNSNENKSQDSQVLTMLSNEALTAKESHSGNDIIIENTAIETDCIEIKNKHIAVSKPIKQIPEELVSKPERTESKGKNKLSLKKSLSKSNCNPEATSKKSTTKPKEKSPNNLTKECIVVIQNKIFKNDNDQTNLNVSSQESDTDCDIPLSLLKRKSTDSVTLNTLNDDDFIRKPSKDASKKKRNLSTLKQSKNSQKSIEFTNISQSSQDNSKRTIVIKKTYDKVTLPLKAKSTGSITQKDIDELKARIETKKNLLMAKAMANDTEELRGLIKKWQKGCQEALMELLELMKKKLPDQHNMDYAEMLHTLKIPPELVGYDAENDCFVTPDDINVLISTFKL